MSDNYVFFMKYNYMMDVQAILIQYEPSKINNINYKIKLLPTAERNRYAIYNILYCASQDIVYLINIFR